MERKLVITGKGRHSAKPDMVIITFPLEVRNPSYEFVLNDLKMLVISLKKALSDSSVDPLSLKTSDFSVDTYTEWNEKTRKNEFVGFVTRQKLSLDLPLDNSLINKVLNNILNLNTPIEFNMTFGVMDKESCLKFLLENAITNAKQKANIIASASEVRLREIIAIDYSFSEVHFRSDLVMDMSTNVMRDHDPFPDMNPEDIQLTENVTIAWRIE